MSKKKILFYYKLFFAGGTEHSILKLIKKLYKKFDIYVAYDEEGSVDIVLNNGTERHLNLGIPSIHSDVFTKQFTNDLVDRFAKDNIMGVTHFFEIKSMPPISRRGMDAISINEETGKINNYIKIDFYYGGQEFYSIMKEYNEKLKEAQKETEETKKTK